jgi:hypothetical protein
MPWFDDPLRRRVHDFERVLNAYYPTVTDARLGEPWRKVLRSMSALRYHTRVYSHPLELRALQYSPTNDLRRAGSNGSRARR